MCDQHQAGLDGLADRFEAQRAELRAVAYRMLGSVNEADDAVQEAWLRLQRSDVAAVQNLRGWLITVVGRICLDMLRSRSARREDPLETRPSEPIESLTPTPESEAILADSVGLALLVVLDTLTPDERLAFVLHDVFGVSFREIAPVLERTPAATKMLASRARRRIQATDTLPENSQARRHEIVTAFLAAARDGNFDALLTLLHPDAVLQADATAAQMGAPSQLHGAGSLARQFAGRAQAARPALIDGAAGAAWAPGGVLTGVFTFTIVDDRIQRIDVITDPSQVARLSVEFVAAR